MTDRIKFATQMDAALLSDLRALAEMEGRQIQALVDEAVADLLEKRRQGKARPHVMERYRASIGQFGPLYERLAK